MGQEHDGAAGEGGDGQVLRQGRGKSFGEVWTLERYAALLEFEGLG